MSPPTFHFDPTEASKQILRHGINRASMMKKRASHLGKRANLATKRFNPHPILLQITDIEGRGTPADPEFKYWNTSVTNVQQVQSCGGENHVRVRGYTRPIQYYVKNIFGEPEPSTALYSNPEYARSSTCLSALSVRDAFENFDGAHTIATDSESSSVASIPDDFEVNGTSTHGTASQRTSLTSMSARSSVASSFACATSCAMESTTNMSETTDLSQRSPLISIPDIPDSAPVLPDFFAGFEPFEVHFPAETTSIRISFTLSTHEAPTPGYLSPLPSLLQPGLPQQLDIVEESGPATPELPPPDQLPVIPGFAPFDPYNQAYHPNPAGRYSGMRWARVNAGPHRHRPYTVCAPSSLSSPRTPQFAAEGVPSSTSELFLSPRPSPQLPGEESTETSTSATPHTRPITITLRPSSTPSITHIVPRKPVPKATPETSAPISDAIPEQPPRHGDRFVPRTTSSRHAANLNSRYPKLDTNKPLPTTPHRYPATHRRSRHTPLPRKANWAQHERPTTPENVEQRPSGRTISGNHSPQRSPVEAKGNHSLRLGWNKMFGKK